jgi:hypothetical protein
MDFVVLEMLFMMDAIHPPRSPGYSECHVIMGQYWHSLPPFPHPHAGCTEQRRCMASNELSGTMQVRRPSIITPTRLSLSPTRLKLSMWLRLMSRATGHLTPESQNRSTTPLETPSAHHAAKNEFSTPDGLAVQGVLGSSRGSGPSLQHSAESAVREQKHQSGGRVSCEWHRTRHRAPRLGCAV